MTIAERLRQSLDAAAPPPEASIPGFSAVDGRPAIGLDPGSLYAYGHLIRLAEQLISASLVGVVVGVEQRVHGCAAEACAQGMRRCGGATIDKQDSVAG